MTDTYTPKTDLSGKAKEVVRDVKAKAAGMTEDITKAAKDNAAQLGNSAKEFASTAKDKVGEAVDAAQVARCRLHRLDRSGNATGRDGL